ncbi:MAG: sulfide/dihydroorotate dehydrogenase-like FAD/NAD-binding protein [bacterium]|nr:sulfide/dihydroorotate dehydrogenase-like FAD/NAD-binding protein [bacterium]
MGYPILAREVLADRVKKLVVSAPLIAKKRRAGQFIILRTTDAGERIPLTIADADAVAGTLTLIFQEVGKSTFELGEMYPGQELADLCGPLGKPTHIEQKGTVVVVGGGIGVAPVHPIAQAMKQIGNTVLGIIGARTKELLIMEAEMAKICDKLYITTDDGSYGTHGFVTDVLRVLIAENDVKEVVAIGPVPMMNACCKVTLETNTPTLVSLNPIMVDGTGMCGACRVTVGGRTRFVCVDGPEFNGHEVDFKELMLRQRQYLPQEQESLTMYRSHHQQHA